MTESTSLRPAGSEVDIFIPVTVEGIRRELEREWTEKYSSVLRILTRERKTIILRKSFEQISTLLEARDRIRTLSSVDIRPSILKKSERMDFSAIILRQLEMRSFREFRERLRHRTVKRITPTREE